MQAVARAGVAGGGARLGVLVRAREAEFWAPNASRKSFRQLLAKMLLAARISTRSVLGHTRP